MLDAQDINTDEASIIDSSIKMYNKIINYIYYLLYDYSRDYSKDPREIV